MLVSAPAQLLTSTWKNVTGNWSDGGNWFETSVPLSSNDTVLVDGNGSGTADDRQPELAPASMNHREYQQ